MSDLADWQDAGENDFSGWLEKLDDDLSMFTNRWFVLHDGCLSVFQACPPGALRPAPNMGTGVAADICEIVDLRAGFSFPAGDGGAYTGEAAAADREL